MGIWWLVFGATTLILVAVLWFRLHALLTLLAAALLVAVLTPRSAIERFAGEEVAANRMNQAAADKLVKTIAPTRLAEAFGQTAGQVGIMIALASVVGICLMESGAAQSIVGAMLRISGVRRAPEALALSAFVLSIPVFFDTVFYLMVPLARSLRRQVGKHYVLYLMAIMAGGSIAHSLVPPTPGPLQVAALLKIDILTMMVAGLVIGGCSSFVSLWAARAIDWCTDVPLRDLTDTPAEHPAEVDPRQPPADASRDGGAERLDDVSRTLPPLWFSLLPILVPVLLISLGAVSELLRESLSAQAASVIALVSHKDVAMGIAVVIALGLLRYTPESHDRGGVIPRALSSGGQIILITSAGGALGMMLRQAGIASAVSELVVDVPGAMLLVVVFLVTASIRTLQGSATVSMITAAGVLQGLADVENLPFHPVYLAMAIGAGSKPISWMTDSGFWIICKMSGMTDREGLRVISPMTIAMGFSALFFTLLFSWIYPAV